MDGGDFVVVRVIPRVRFNKFLPGRVIHCAAVGPSTSCLDPGVWPYYFILSIVSSDEEVGDIARLLPPPFGSLSLIDFWERARKKKENVPFESNSDLSLGDARWFFRAEGTQGAAGDRGDRGRRRKGVSSLFREGSICDQFRVLDVR